MQGPEAASPRFGPYRFDAIVDALGATGTTVHAPLRPRSQDNGDAAALVAANVRALLASGVPASAITVVGASRGAIIAMLVSDRLSQPTLRFVLMGACNDWVFDQLRPTLSGAFLSIYEAGDEFGGSCELLMRTQPGVRAFEEIRLETGLGHGFLYAPLDAWVRPAMRWSQASMPNLDE